MHQKRGLLDDPIRFGNMEPKSKKVIVGNDTCTKNQHRSIALERSVI